MKKVRIAFEYEGYEITAKGTVWDSLYVNNLDYTIKDESGEDVSLSRKDYDNIRELAEELILDEYNNTELYFNE